MQIALIAIPSLLVFAWLLSRERAKAFFLAAAVASGVAALSIYLKNNGHDIKTLYVALRPGLFSGFLTLGGFLLSLKTFILIKMKEALYDNKLYRANVKAQLVFTRANKGIHAKPSPKDLEILYVPLARLRGLLFWSIVSSLATATIQVTGGVIDNEYADVACLAAGGWTVAMLGQSLFHINDNLKNWFKWMTKEAIEAEAAAERENAAKVAAEPDSDDDDDDDSAADPDSNSGGSKGATASTSSGAVRQPTTMQNPTEKRPRAKSARRSRPKLSE